MPLRKLVILVIAVLMLGWTSVSIAQDAKKDVKKDAKPAVTETKKDGKAPANDPKKQAKPKTMKYVGCSQPGCGFWAKSSSSKELKGIMKRHAKRHHKIELTDKQLKEMIKKQEAK